MIQLESVIKTYTTRRGDVLALNDVSVGIETGEYVAVVGPPNLPVPVDFGFQLIFLLY